MTTERDTHFAGFAKLLVDELDSRSLIPVHPRAKDAMKEAVAALIAQRAFDLAEHVYNHTTEAMTAFSSFAVIAEENDIPDLTTLPPAAPESAAG